MTVCSDFDSELPVTQNGLSKGTIPRRRLSECVLHRTHQPVDIPSSDGRLGDILSGVVVVVVTEALPFDEEEGVARRELLMGLEYELDADELQDELAACSLVALGGIGIEDDMVGWVTAVYGARWALYIEDILDGHGQIRA